MIVPAIIGVVVWLSGIREIYAVILRSSFSEVAGAFVLSMIAVGLTAIKWRFVIPAIGVAELFKAALIGQFYSFFFLGQASGEAAKIYLISRESGNVSGATVSVFTDRLTSFIGLLTVSVLGFAMSSSHYPQKLQQIALIGLMLLVAILVALRHDAFFFHAERIATWFESRAPAYSSAIARELRRAIEQWHAAVSNPWRVMAGVLVGALVHIVNVLTFMVLAVGIGVNMDFYDWCWVAGLTSVAGLIPITIGQMTAGGALVALLHMQNVSMVDAVALSALIIAVNGMLAIVGSLLEWRRLHFRVAAPSASDGISNP
ncbi:MAG: flippase-like domain-containing protein [Bradyrhizobium sp.]|uniref:lysylphosphatidylglycerol synthase transmembrane domain-containing protein n=1 Tax=Bradyrhizobium sp. TaxID=376 RepID=UPI0025C33A25|nr:lysylphosphatidylglycerol synthase transmembrane domain-containing protein [Bradyrhizobium sp.]MBI5261248.1 flippase-like domain-containing protein [Bradyrhizobium sp.]